MVQTTWTARDEVLRRSFPHGHGEHTEAELPTWTVPFVMLSDLAEAGEAGPEDIAALLNSDGDPA